MDTTCLGACPGSNSAVILTLSNM